MQERRRAYYTNPQSMGQAYSGTSAYDIDRFARLPEIEYEEYEVQEAPRVEPQRRAMPQQHRRPRRAPRQSVSGFAVLGCVIVCILLLLVVLSHMQLSLMGSEVWRLEQEVSSLQEESARLHIAHGNAFLHVNQYARDELGMIDPMRGQIVAIGNSIGDVVEVLAVEEVAQTSIVEHLMGLLREYLPFFNE